MGERSPSTGSAYRYWRVGGEYDRKMTKRASVDHWIRFFRSGDANSVVSGEAPLVGLIKNSVAPWRSYWKTTRRPSGEMLAYWVRPVPKVNRVDTARSRSTSHRSDCHGVSKRSTTASCPSRER